MKWSYAISDLLMQSSYYCFILQCNSWWLLLNHLCLSVHSLVVWYCWLWIKHTQIYYFLLVYMNCACKMYYMYIYVWTYTIPYSSIFFFCNLECLCMSPLAQRLGTFSQMSYLLTMNFWVFQGIWHLDLKVPKIKVQWQIKCNQYLSGFSW